MSKQITNAWILLITSLSWCGCALLTSNWTNPIITAGNIVILVIEMVLIHDILSFRANSIKEYKKNVNIEINTCIEIIERHIVAGNAILLNPSENIDDELLKLEIDLEKLQEVQNNLFHYVASTPKKYKDYHCDLLIKSKDIKNAVANYRSALTLQSSGNLSQSFPEFLSMHINLMRKKESEIEHKVFN